MAASTSTLVLDSSTDTAFRAFVNTISTAISTAGMVQTADTGQINPATVTHPTATATSQGYQIWRFNDSLQAAAPVYMKIEYGSATSAGPGLWFTVGTGSDGAGNITNNNIPGVTASVQRVNPMSSTWNGTHTFYANGGGSALMMGWVDGAGTSSLGWLFILERTRAWDGSPTGDGFMLAYAYYTNSTGANAGYHINYIPGSINYSTTSSISGFNPNPSGGNVPSTLIDSSGKVLTVPILTGSGVKIGAPSKYIVAVNAGDYPGDKSVTFTHYGVSGTWRTAGQGYYATNGNWGSFPFGTRSFLMRID